MSITTASALAGAVALNLPILIAGTALPLTTLVTAGVVLALLGAKLGWLIGWSFAGSRHDVIELIPAIAEEERIAA